MPSELILDVDDGMKDRWAVNLHNAVTVPQERLGRCGTSLDVGSERMQQGVCSVAILAWFMFQAPMPKSRLVRCLWSPPRHLALGRWICKRRGGSFAAGRNHFVILDRNCGLTARRAQRAVASQSANFVGLLPF